MKWLKKTGDIKKFYQYAFPIQSALVTCNNAEGETNVITIAWHTPISKKPPLYAISVAPSRFSHDLIRNSGEFVVNFAPINIVDKVHFCGSNSGRNVNKLEETDLTLGKSNVVNTPIIKECFAHLECNLYESTTFGDHTLFIGEVVNILFDEKSFKNDLLENQRIRPCYYVGSNTYTTIDKTRNKF